MQGGEFGAVTLGGELRDEGQQPVGDGLEQVAEGEDQRADGHGQADGDLGVQAEQDHVGGAQDAGGRGIRRNIGSDGDGAHEQSLDAGTQGKAGLQVTEYETEQRTDHDGTEDVQRAELVIEELDEYVECGTDQ